MVMAMKARIDTMLLFPSYHGSTRRVYVVSPKQDVPAELQEVRGRRVEGSEQSRHAHHPLLPPHRHSFEHHRQHHHHHLSHDACFHHLTSAPETFEVMLFFYAILLCHSIQKAMLSWPKL